MTSDCDPMMVELIARQPAAHSLQRELYDSEAAFQRDVERIFMRHWLLAGHASSAPEPGDWFLYEAVGESVIIVRGKDRQLRALLNVCRHRGSVICREPAGHAAVLVCPYHAWAYNLDGSLRSARHMEAEFDKSAHGLKQLALEVIEGLVFIAFAERPLGLDNVRLAVRSAYGPYGWANAKVAKREIYPIDANWKLAVENYLECYHCAPAHPEYSKLHALEQPMAKIAGLNEAMERRTRGQGIAIQPVDRWAASDSGQEAAFSFRYALYEEFDTGSYDGRAVAPLMGDFSAYDGGVTSTHVGPASFVIAYPDHGVLYRFMPLTAGRTAMEVVWLVRSDARAGIDYDVDRLTWLWRVTSEADKRITEDNQKGVSSRFYRPGPYAPVEPNAIRYVDWYLREIA